MKFIQLYIALLLVALARAVSSCGIVFEDADVYMAIEDTNNVIVPSGDNQWQCRASSFPQYLNSLLGEGKYPNDCETPAIDIFKGVDIVLIEELSEDVFEDSGMGMNLTETNNVMTTVNYFGRHSVGISRYCYNEYTSNCPSGFVATRNISAIVGDEKVVIYHPASSESILSSLKEMTNKNILAFSAIKENTLYSEDEVTDKNIIFVTVVMLVIVSAVCVIVVATIDYGDDYAGLYAKYKQEKSQ